MNGLIGRKLGMTQIYSDAGEAIPVTVIQAGPCAVVQVKTAENGGNVQLGFGQRKMKHATKAQAGHAKSAGLETIPGILRDFTLVQGTETPKRGDTVTVGMFAAGDSVKVTGTTKGRGFQGVVKRYGFRGGPASHGSTRYRKPGSMGPGTDPSRVIKGKKLPGQYGAKRMTELGLRVERVDTEENLLFVRGAVPGPTRGIVLIRKQEGRGRYA
jgi:large subunit ribosomal protein L3